MKYGLIFHAVGILLLILLVFKPHFWSFLLYLVWLVRVFCLHNRQFLRQFVVIQLLLGMFFVYHKQEEVSHLTGKEQQFMLDVAVTDIKVEGNLLSLKGQTSDTVDGKSEKIQVFYTLPDEQSQKDWMTVPQSVRVFAEGTLEVPNQNGNFYLFNYQEYLKRQDIYWILSADEIRIESSLSSFTYWLPNTAQAITQWLQTLSNQTVQAYSLSLFFNQMDALDEDALSAYQTIGLIHLFSISGFHVQYFLRIFKNIFLRMGLTVEHFDLIAILILGLYTMILGMPYGLIRSTMAYSYNVIQDRRGQDPSSIMGTTWAMQVLMILDPQVIFSLSFQLTFALSYTILFTGQAIQARYQHPLMVELWQSFTCTLVTIPFLIMTYFEFSWIALFLNYVYSWVFAAFLFPGLLSILALHIFTLANYFWWLQSAIAYIIQGVEGIAKFAQSWTWFHWITGRPQTWVLLFFVCSLLYFLVSLSEPQLQKSAHIFIAIAILALYANPYLHRYGQVAMVDVGQGDSLLLEMPYQSNVYAIDLAGKMNFSEIAGETKEEDAWKMRDSDSLAERQLIPMYKAAGVRRLKGVFLTHGDYDHIGSFVEIAATFPIENLYLPIGMQADKESLTTIEAGIQAGRNPDMNIIWLRTGDQMNLNRHTKLLVLAPSEVSDGENKDSLVLYGQIGLHRFLFTGDIEGAEEGILPQVPVDILKVAHHGSENSTPPAFIEKIQPKIAWISVGKENRYGHPSERVVADLTAAGVEIQRTDTMGAVHYIYWPKSAKIETVH
ncbi:DNA internalization-related competence protein ComEC/Rec2 [Aerococcus agrisoli]|uniref:DNA internalization-related competence protein ComEC/Rec2 n=1 Tax=Aerococcus agrisoli TaxID=2487350 RepID=A0A3N4GHX4_9LACT|nr:DNA internalization-related competence protein ComEC/Rec2 [Aerococcus agrisoli]RPA61308.1 DNA internalization-related competence protein ComEC/Rec2 [Aerococcus agrisoli]